MKVVDNRGLSCPQPVINTKRALDEITDGEIISLVDNPVARENIMKYARSQGFVAEATQEGGTYSVKIHKGEASAAVTSAPAEALGTILYLIRSDVFGEGDRALGSALMKTFVYSLAENCQTGNRLVLVNSAVRLACRESAVLGSLTRLVEQGWEVMSCGTCLDFYNLNNATVVGSVTNMYSIVELMAAAEKTITI